MTNEKTRLLESLKANRKRKFKILIAYRSEKSISKAEPNEGEKGNIEE